MRAHPDRKSFEILGISLWGYSLDWPQKIVQKLGRGTVVERGDAAGGRAQLCYQSFEQTHKTKLIFETGECSESFYLFEDGEPFVGSDKCVSSTVVSDHLETASKLRLGLTRKEVTRILGMPSTNGSDFVVYDYDIEMKRTKEQLEAFKREDPETEPDLEYDLWLSILIRFRNDRSWFEYIASGTC